MLVPTSIQPRAIVLSVLLILCYALQAQTGTIRGTVTDNATGETLIGATVLVKGTTLGTVTDIDGRFLLQVDQPPPITLVVNFLGYAEKEVEVQDLSQQVRIKLGTDQVLLREAEVVGSRITEKQKQAPLTVESLDVLAIREAPSGDFYESLGTLKGVDLVTASFGFKVINTRGFNSTSPVRSLQLIDGVDNQSPGLNFSLGNFLGASDLDVMRVDVIAGASTAYFGPGAFNGVVNMTTKSPWMFPGLSISAKGGERSLLEGAVRWAEVFKNAEGRPRFAYKLNLYAMQAEDWRAEDLSPTSNSPTGRNNPGGHDAVNVYGDENTTTNNNFLRSYQERRDYPGLGIILRSGYRETDLVDYGTNNLKAGASAHYMLTDSIELIAAANYSRGSTVYQGENRYRLKNIQFHQERLEIRQPGKWFLRGYMTGEDAGDTYDIFTAGIRLTEDAGATTRWVNAYSQLWGSWQRPIIQNSPGYITQSEFQALGWTTRDWIAWQEQWLVDNNAWLTTLHAAVRDSVERMNTSFLDPRLEPGTAEFDAALEDIKSRRLNEGGALFFDRSRLMHGMGEYRTRPLKVARPDAVLIFGGSYRQYLPNSQGTIFRDTADVVIRNREGGAYVGLEDVFMKGKLRTTLTLRVDKNENFDYLASPAASLVYTPHKDRTFRVSFSSAIRNPTLADQFLYYNVGRAILLGNVDGQFEEGRDSLITLSSFNAYRNTADLNAGLAKLEYFHVDRLRPEKVRTIELGYRGTHFENFYVDANLYNSWYTDFIGFILGLSAQFDQQNGFPIGGVQAYRLSANATDQVLTRGASIGVSYYRPKATYGFNYSYNQLVSGDEDPIIPAFNTPLNKFNLSVSGHDLKIPFTQRRHLGYGVSYRYVESFVFEGSPQFTGRIPSYDMVDVQVNVKFPAQNLMAKIGCSNLFGLVPLFDAQVPESERFNRVWDNRVQMVFGGPYVGRLAYIQLVYEWDRR